MANLNVNGKMMQWGGDMLPIGMMLPYAGKTIPKNFLLCNGSSFNQTEYPELYSILGTNVLPNLTNRFIEGSSLLTSNANDSTRYVAAGLPNITGTTGGFLSDQQNATYSGAFYQSTVSRVRGWSGVDADEIRRIGFDANNGASVKGIYRNDVTTVQPPAYKAAWMIKAK